MEVFYIVCISVLGFFLLYLIVKSQISTMMETRLKALYKDRIAADIQDIYRELESYSSIIDSRIGRLKTLTERHEANIKAWETIQGEMKKSKTAKEFLTYINENRQEFKPDKEFSENLKKEIIGELKKYLAARLNLPNETPQPKSAITDNRPVAKTAANQKTSPRTPLRTSEKMAPVEDDLNLAELIIDDLDARQATRENLAVKNFNREKTSIGAGKTAPANLPSLQTVTTRTRSESTGQTTKQNPLVDSSPASGSFSGFLASVGRALAPLFMPSEKPSPVTNSAAAFDDIGPRNRNFNDLLKKEIVTSDTLSQARKNPVPGNPAATGSQRQGQERQTMSHNAAGEKFPVEKDFEPSFKPLEEFEDASAGFEKAPPITPKNLIKSMNPEELIQLFEQLKTSRSRPEALKNLLSQGFKMEQIAELSNVPYSDLELTRNLYRI